MPTKVRSVSKRQTSHKEGARSEKPEPQKQPKRTPFLNEAQAKIADTVSELLVKGGTRENLDALTELAADHLARRTYLQWMKEDDPKFENRVDEWRNTFSSKWFDQLAQARAAREELPAASKPEPKDVTELIRAQKRSELDDSFKGFLVEAAPEEVHLMYNVLTDWSSISSGWGTGFESMALANAFELQIQREGELVRVPQHLVKDVEKYIAALLKSRPEKEEGCPCQLTTRNPLHQPDAN